MQKTKIGVTTGVLGAAICFTALFNGYVGVFLLAGYVLLCEDNEWLRWTAVKVVTAMMCFSVLVAVIGFVPELIGFIDDICRIFNGTFSFNFLVNLTNAVTSGIYLMEKALFLVLGVKALHQGSIAIPIVDTMLEKYM